jgi:hypothetical protein
MKNINKAQKVALTYIRSLGLPVIDYHVGSSIANIVYGHTVNHESCLRDTRTFLRSEGIKLEEDQVVEMIEQTRAAL